MILHWQPWKIIVLGMVMSLIGMILPLLMVLDVVKSTLFLNFLSYGLSVFGLIIGFAGMTLIIKLRRDDDHH